MRVQAAGGDGPDRRAFSSPAAMAEHNANSEHGVAVRRRTPRQPALARGSLSSNDLGAIPRIPLAADEIDAPLASIISRETLAPVDIGMGNGIFLLRDGEWKLGKR
jgi:hypothetical protein